MSNRKSREPTSSPVSRALRETISERGLTAYAAAKQAGVSVDAVQRFLNEQRGLNLTTVDKLADALGLTLCESDSPAGRA
jgi:plasmid maintenance system antidote protein VapI